MALFRNGIETTDEWVALDLGDPVPHDASIIVTKERYLAEHAALNERNAPIGVRIEAGENLDGLVDDLGRLDLVALVFPKYSDGRAYSTARILRDRYGFKGELRAVGNVLHDQVNFMRRCGFDALEVTHDYTLAALREGRIRGFTGFYQPASDEAHEVEAEPNIRHWLRAQRA